MHLRRAIQRLVRRLQKREAGGKSRPLPGRKLVYKQPSTHQQAAAKLIDHAAVKTVKEKQREIKENLDMREGDPRLHFVHPEIILFRDAFEKALYKRGIPFKTFELYRSPERQQRLLKNGVTRAGPGQSPHQYGMAVDEVHATRFWDLTRKEWDLIGAIGKEAARRVKVKVEWGGDFRTIYDPAHWQLEGWRERRGYTIEAQQRGFNKRQLRQDHDHRQVDRYFNWLASLFQQ